MALDRKLAGRLLEHLRGTRRWKLDGDDDAAREGRHRSFFAVRRAESLIAVQPAFASEAGFPGLAARLATELDAVEGYLLARLGSAKRPGPLGGGPDPVKPPHLDLEDVARTHVDTAPKEVVNRSARYRAERRRRARTIVWRATAIHRLLWVATPASSTLQVAFVDQLLDRRLRTIERMAYNVASAEALGGRRWGEIRGKEGPWRDGFRVRPFEYPRIPQPNGAIVAAIGEGNIGPGHLWRWGQKRRRLEYYAVRFPERAATTWYQAPHYYCFRDAHAPLSPAQAIDALFMVGVPDLDRTNWWQRAWLYCDHVCSALHIEALLHTMRRVTGNDDAFNTIEALHPSANPEAFYLALANFVGTRWPFAAMMCDFDQVTGQEKDPYFRNRRDLDSGDIQAGDQVIFWNSLLYPAISQDEWSLENSIVMDVDSDADTGMRVQDLRLQGHGVAERGFSQYQQQILTPFSEALKDVQATARAIGTGAPTIAMPLAGRPRGLVRWNPFEPLGKPGAWWLHIGKPDTSSHEEAEEALYSLLLNHPHTVKPAGLQGPGSQRPVLPDGTKLENDLFFPLFQPVFPGGWHGYLSARSASTSVKLPRLEPLAVDASLMPGLFRDGKPKPISAVQPRTVGE